MRWWRRIDIQSEGSFMKYGIALPTLALLVASGCSGNDATAPLSADRRLLSVVSRSASSEREGTFHGVKECSGFTGGAGSFCEIQLSNVRQIPTGSHIIYLNPAAVFTPTGTDVILADLPQGTNAAFGHCALNAAIGRGLCTFSGGTGKFKQFRASFTVSAPKDLSWQLDGPYSFGDDGEEN
jgi:hypothetical protein